MPTTPITIDALRQLAFSQLVASAAVAAWTATHFPARKLLITDGADATSQAEFDVIPAIGLFNGDESEDPGTGEKLFTIIAECRIRDRLDSVTAGIGDVSSRVYTWPSLSAALARLVRSELQSAFAATNAPVRGWSIAYNHRDAWPVILASVSLNFRIPFVIGPELELL